MSEIIAVSIEELEKFGCPSCGYYSSSISLFREGAVFWQCGDSVCRESCVGLPKGVTESPIDINSEGGIFYPELQKHPRYGIPSHGTPDKRPEGGGEFFCPSGIGLDSIPGCFVCGGKEGLYNNIVAFTQCKIAGERVVAMLGKGAILDHRDNKSDYWIKIKVGACNSHKSNLKLLHDLTYKKEGVITEEIIQQAVSL